MLYVQTFVYIYIHARALSISPLLFSSLSLLRNSLLRSSLLLLLLLFLLLLLPRLGGSVVVVSFVGRMEEERERWRIRSLAGGKKRTIRATASRKGERRDRAQIEAGKRVKFSRGGRRAALHGVD